MSDAQRYRKAGAVAAAILAVVGVIGVVLATRGGGDDPGSAGDSTEAVVTEPATTEASTTEASTSSSSSTTSSTSTSPPTTAGLPPVPVSVTLKGPTQLQVGVQGEWTVTQTNAVSGVWSTSPPMELTDDQWAPGGHFFGSWNQPTRITITLIVEDKFGNQASDSITVDVVA